MLPPAPHTDPVEVVVPAAPGQGLVDDAVAGGPAVVRLAPGVDRFGFLVTAISKVRMAALARDGAASRRASVLIVCPSIDSARRLSTRLRRTGLPVALVADERPGTRTTEQWARAAAGGAVVVGARSAAWMPAPELALGIVVDEHDEAHQNEQTPTWHTRDVMAERCRRAGAPFVMLSACPTAEALALGRLLTPSRSEERAGWAPFEVIDRRGEDPTTASSLFSPRLAELLRTDGRVICVLNRKGRARLLACRGCEELARCATCGAAVRNDDDGVLRCSRCEATRPVVCDSCGGTAFRVIRVGVTRARADLEALLAEPVHEVSGPASHDDDAVARMERTRVLIGTEAVLHRVGQAAVVVFLDFDSELTAPRFRAGEQALSMVARAARLAGPRSRGHRVVVQTRIPEHAVIQSALHADPGLLTEAEAPVRQALRFPPYGALAQVSGQGAPEFIAGLRSAPGLELLGEAEGPWLVRATDHVILCDALAATPRPGARVRIEVDPLGV